MSLEMPAAAGDPRTQPPQRQTGPSRLRSLDVLRGVAILLVLGRHEYVVWVWYQIGWTGVDLFFVLSGFLVSGLLFTEVQKHGRLDWARFFIRRGLKIYPPFYALLLVTVLHGQAIPSGEQAWRLLHEALFVQNYLPRIWGHTWSLAIEEHFYLMLPLVLLVLLKRRTPGSEPFARLPLLTLGIALWGLLARSVALVLAWPGPTRHLQFQTHLRIDSLFFGVLLSYLHHYWRQQIEAAVRRWRWPLALAVPVFLGVAIFVRPKPLALQAASYTLIYLAYGAVLLLALYAAPRVQWRLVDRVLGILAFIGTYSYSIYLWHVPIREWVVIPNVPNFYKTHSLGRATLYFVGCIVVGVAAGKLLELPVLRLRERWFPSRSGSLARPEP